METYFSRDHEWVRFEEGRATVGISAHAAKELGDITFVELPKVGKAVGRSEVLAAIESVKAANDIYSPVSGTVVEVNEALEDHPELVNEDAEGAGWIVRLEPREAEADVAALMTGEQYEEFLRSGA